MIKLTKDQIKSIAEDLEMSHQCFYHLPTGKVVSILEIDDGAFDDEIMEELEREQADIEENREDYLEFEKMPPHESFIIMEDFIDLVSDTRLADRLAHAIRKSKPFRHFKDIVDDSIYREKWFRFRDERAIAWINQQIDDFNER